jgi:hypothetical protein
MLNKSIKSLIVIMILFVLVINFFKIPSVITFVGAFVLVGIFIILLFIQGYKKKGSDVLNSDIAEMQGNKSIGASGSRINSFVGIVVLLVAIALIGFGFVYYLDHF